MIGICGNILHDLKLMMPTNLWAWTLNKQRQYSLRNTRSLLRGKMTKAELIEELRKMDEVSLLELLNIKSDDIVDAFYDVISENQSKLIQAIYDN